MCDSVADTQQTLTCVQSTRISHSKYSVFFLPPPGHRRCCGAHPPTHPPVLLSLVEERRQVVSLLGPEEQLQSKRAKLTGPARGSHMHYCHQSTLDPPDTLDIWVSLAVPICFFSAEPTSTHLPPCKPALDSCDTSLLLSEPGNDRSDLTAVNESLICGEFASSLELRSAACHCFPRQSVHGNTQNVTKVSMRHTCSC